MLTRVIGSLFFAVLFAVCAVSVLQIPYLAISGWVRNPVIDGNALAAIPFLLVVGMTGLLLAAGALHFAVSAVRPTGSGVPDATTGSAYHGDGQREPKGPIGFDHHDDGDG